ncbi:AMP-binding protein, partial [Acetobacter senegalensis]|nr:AMP-binding protein [Acetobacter senegalensis]
MYTSGSTGKPKGVGITHQNLASHVTDAIRRFGINQTDTVLQFSTLNFDGAVEPIFSALTQCAVLLLRGNLLWTHSLTTQNISKESVTVAFFPAGYLRYWLENSDKISSSLRLVMSGGEKLSGAVISRWLTLGKAHVRLENRYGPTETTAAVITRTAVDNDALLPVVPIGLPFPSRSVSIAGQAGIEVPCGGVGELCIGGVTLARGYLGQAGLTAERFVPDPAI